MGYGNGGMTAIIGGGLPVPRSEPTPSDTKVRDAFSVTEDCIGQLYDAIGALQERLDTILTPEPPATNAADKAGPSTIAAHLTNRIQDANGKLVAAVAWVNYLRSRIEL